MAALGGVGFQNILANQFHSLGLFRAAKSVRDPSFVSALSPLRDAGATSATAAQSVYMSVYRRRWGAEFALQGARMRIARAYLVTGQAEPAPRDPRGGGFDPGDAAAFAAASAPSLPGVPQGQSGFASRGG